MGRSGKGYNAQEALDQLKNAGVPRGMARGVGLAIGGIFLAGAAMNSLYTVQGGFKAIKFNMLTGLDPRSFEAGTHVKIPYLEKPILFDIRQQPISIQSSQGSRDLQIVNTTVRVLYKANESNLPELYRTLGQNYADVVLPSISNEVLKSVIVQMNFGKEYTAAVESKQIAQQMAERARFKVEQAQQEKKGVIILAEGEAESAKLIGNAIKNNRSFIDLRRMEAAKEISSTLAKSPNKLTLDADALLLNLTAKVSKQ